MTAQMKPTKYALLRDDDRIILRAYCPDAVGGFFNVEIMTRYSGGFIPGLRRHAQHLAKAWGVPLEDTVA